MEAHLGPEHAHAIRQIVVVFLVVVFRVVQAVIRHGAHRGARVIVEVKHAGGGFGRVGGIGRLVTRGGRVRGRVGRENRDAWAVDGRSVCKLRGKTREVCAGSPLVEETPEMVLVVVRARTGNHRHG
jgi:hypothetical protein